MKMAIRSFFSKGIPFFLLFAAAGSLGADFGTLTPEKASALTRIDSDRAKFEAVAKFIWEHPELSLVEFKAAEALIKPLKENGFAVKQGLSGMPTAFSAEWGSGKPVIALLAEYDALPNLSQKAGVLTEDPVTARAPGHGCGHNLFGAFSAAAAVAIKTAMEKHKVKGTVKLFGTPAEETLVGKVFMARDNLFSGVDALILWHPGSNNGVGYGSNLAMTSVKFRFKGRSSHAAVAPQAGRSALDGVELLNIAMNYLREHVPEEARIMYVITEGGEVPNNVPPDAEVWYYLRAPRRFQVDSIWVRMLDAAKGAALMSQTTVSHKILSATWEVLPNKVLSKIGHANAQLVGAPAFTLQDQELGARFISAMGKPAKGPAYDTAVRVPELDKSFPDVPLTKGSSDHANLTWMIPTVSFSAAASVKQTPGHSWIQVSQSCLPPAMTAGVAAAKYMAATALDLFTHPSAVAEARKELDGVLAETKYTHPIPKELPLPTFKDLYGTEPGKEPVLPK